MVLRSRVELGCLAALCLAPTAYAQFDHPGASHHPAASHATAPQPNLSTPITLRAPSSQTLAVGAADDANAADSALADGGDGESSAPAMRGRGASGGNLIAPLVTIGSSLAIVLGLFAALVWVTRKSQRGGTASGTIPDETLRVLGQKSLGNLGTVSLVRCGRSILVLSSSANGVQSLASITDEAEVRELEAACRGESQASFQQVLGEVAKEPSGRGFLGDGYQTTPSHRRLFA